MKREDVKGGLIAHWSHGSKNYFIVNDVSDKNITNKKEYILLANFFKKISLYEPSFLISIRDGAIIADKLKIISSVKNSLKAGFLFGTKESLLLKLDKIEASLQDCQIIKLEALSNIYNSLIDISQALCLSREYGIPAPKVIPDFLRKNFHDLDEITIEYCENIIKYYRAVETKKILKIDGKTLDNLSSQLNLVREKILMILEKQNV